MRTVQVSTDTFAAIWAARHEGEESEDAILRRILLGRSAPSTPQSQAIGHRDPRYGVEFDEGFEVFRTYLGREFKARAVAGSWQLQGTGAIYPTLNELSVAIGAKTENAWMNWFYLDDRGQRQPVDAKRDPTKVRRRRLL